MVAGVGGSDIIPARLSHVLPRPDEGFIGTTASVVHR